MYITVPTYKYDIVCTFQIDETGPSLLAANQITTTLVSDNQIYILSANVAMGFRALYPSLAHTNR